MELIEKIEAKIKLLPQEKILQLDAYIDDLISYDKTETHFASQAVLAKEWSTDIEDEVWKDL